MRSDCKLSLYGYVYVLNLRYFLLCFSSLGTAKSVLMSTTRAKLAYVFLDRTITCTMPFATRPTTGGWVFVFVLFFYLELAIFFIARTLLMTDGLADLQYKCVLLEVAQTLAFDRQRFHRYAPVLFCFTTTLSECRHYFGIVTQQ